MMDCPLWMLDIQAEELACMMDNDPLFWHYFINMVYPRELQYGEHSFVWGLFE